MSITAYQLQHLDWTFIVVASVVAIWWAACLSIGWHAVQLVFRAIERSAPDRVPPPLEPPAWINPKIPSQNWRDAS